MNIRTAVDAKEKLLAYLTTLGLAVDSISVRLGDEGFALVVKAPTLAPEQIPEKFQGVRVRLGDSV